MPTNSPGHELATLGFFGDGIGLFDVDALGLRLAAALVTDDVAPETASEPAAGYLENDLVHSDLPSYSYVFT